MVSFTLKKLIVGLSTFFFFINSFASGSCDQPSVTLAEDVSVEHTIFVWNNDRCTPTDTVDIPAKAFVDKFGKVQLLAASSHGSYRMIGSSLDTLKRDCSASVLNSNSPDTLPEKHYNFVWLTNPYTEDGNTIYAIVHNEFHGWVTQPTIYCPSGNQKICWYPNLIMAKSEGVNGDTGSQYQIMMQPKTDNNPNPSAILVAATPYQYLPDGGANGMQQGMPNQTNIIKRDGYYYMMVIRSVGNTVNGNQYPEATCLFRNKDISDPSGWRAWDGKKFTTAMHYDPYAPNPKVINNMNKAICKPISLNDQPFTHTYCTSLSYNKVLKKYLAMCTNMHFKKDDGTYGEAFVYALSDDMIHWSGPYWLRDITWLDQWDQSKPGENPAVVGQAFPTLLDPHYQDMGRNFEYSGSDPYLFYTRLNAKAEGVSWVNRDLVYQKLHVSCGAVRK